ncbi:glycosyltransferase [Fictibacillus macauensis ZFHKF-1]|uniref:Glycosyltransferase n=1 Tax=Fictibacillus macauensis ZFHKF-1 TaxID=1196324 RepID=I8AK57_9BACL|nr:glycosyltransferase family 4 protein [Fictibacillus macauensis]EIT86217.1 glycosyltransferase [Fictibacillus macauensis ZFHKF-1]
MQPFTKETEPFHPFLLQAMDRPLTKPKASLLPAPLPPLATFVRKKPLRILYVTFLRYPNYGGLSNYITSLKQGFEKAGHDVHVLSPVQMPPHVHEHDVPRIATHARAYLQTHFGTAPDTIVKNASYLYVYYHYLKQQALNTYDIIHTQDLFAAFLLAELNKTMRKPLFFTPHGHFTRSRIAFNKMTENSLIHRYFSAIEHVGIAAAHKIITIASSFHPALRSDGARSEQLQTVHTGIDFPYVAPPPPSSSLTITFISRLAPRKGHETFIDALALCREHLQNTAVWIVGDGVMRRHLEAKVKALQLNQVTFFGRREDVPELLAASDIYVLSTHNDNFPLSVIEAMFAGKPIVTTGCGGIPEMITHEETGLLVTSGHTQALSEALISLLSDASLRTRLGTNAAAFAQKHLTQANMVQEIENLYWMAMRKNGPETAKEFF